MPRSKPASSGKTTTVQLRLNAEQKALLTSAAKLRRTTLNDFILECASEAAWRLLAEQGDIVLPPAEWDAFCKALDAPPRSIPALGKLLTEPSIFDGP